MRSKIDKIDKITKIFDSIEHPKNRGVTYWDENHVPLSIHQLPKPVFLPVFFTANYLDNRWPNLFGSISDPPVFYVFYIDMPGVRPYISFNMAPCKQAVCLRSMVNKMVFHRR